MRRAVFCALAAVLASPIAAQPPARPDAGDPQAPAPGVVYRSALESYRRYEEQELRSWREANDEMRALGGHTGHSARPSERDAKAPGKDPKPHHGAHK